MEYTQEDIEEAIRLIRNGSITLDAEDGCKLIDKNGDVIAEVGKFDEITIYSKQLGSVTIIGNITIAGKG